MEILIYVLFGLNAIISIYYMVLMLKGKRLKNATSTFTQHANRQSFDKVKELSLVPRIIATIILVIILIIFIGIVIALTTFFIWIPIVVGFIYDWKFGILTFIACSILISVLWSWILSKNRDKINDGEEAVIREYIFLSTLLQLGIIIYFNSDMSMITSMQYIYANVPLLTNSLTILYPILFFGILISNFYLYFHFVRTKFKKIPQWKIKRTDVLLIFVVSSFIGLLIISEDKLLFIEEGSMDAFLRTLDIIKIFLTAILIPLVFNKLKGTPNGENEEV